jgi:outer membrane protein OmpA-like peptidoglycan-associated protein
MKTSMLLTLPLAATLMVPAVAQQTTSDSQQSSAQSSSSQPTTTSSSQPSSTAPDANTDPNLSARQPLQPETREGFWGKVNPFARKKYVQRQLSPIRNRVNELDDLTAENARQIKDVDARAQEGIRQADAKASQADQHAVEAGSRAQQANQTAVEASNRLTTVQNVVGNIDQYQPATQTEIRFRSGSTALGPKSKEALDDMTANLKDQKGYIIEVQGFSPSGVQASQAMANSVVRYLVEKNNVPVYRIFVMGMGNAKIQTTDGSAKTAHGNRVEISLMKNNVDQLASAQSNGEMGNTLGGQNNGYSTSQNSYSHGTNNSYATQPSNTQPSSQPQQPSSMNQAPASNTTPQQ